MGDALVALVIYLENSDKDMEKNREAIGRLITMVELVRPIINEEPRKKELRKIAPAEVNLPPGHKLISSLDSMVKELKKLKSEDSENYEKAIKTLKATWE